MACHPAIVSGIASAMTSETPPRIPAQATSNTPRHGGTSSRAPTRRPSRAATYAPGNIHTIRTAITVPLTMSACTSKSPADSGRTLGQRPGQLEPDEDEDQPLRRKVTMPPRPSAWIRARGLTMLGPLRPR